MTKVLLNKDYIMSYFKWLINTFKCGKNTGRANGEYHKYSGGMERKWFCRDCQSYRIKKS